MEINKTILDYYLQGENPTQISRLMNIPRDEVTYQINNAYKQHLIPLDSKKRLAQSFLANGYTYEQIANELDIQVSSVLSSTFSVSPDKRKTISKATEKKIVDAYLKGETYTSIKKAYNVCYPTIKKLCRGLPKPEIPLSQIKVIELALKNYNRREIADELKLDYYYVCNLITRSIKQNRLSNNIANQPKITDKTKLIIDDLQNGMPQIRVAKKYNLSRQRINQIIKEQNLTQITKLKH